MNSIEERYRGSSSKSAELAKKAERVMPGGDTRTTSFYRPYPLTIARGEGPYLWDVDGNRYIDLLGNYTSLVHGNAYPPIVEAANKAVASGTAWEARCESQIELAALLCERVASVESVRFCNSGTEAGMLAAHLARRLTGRKLILMARYGYHGSYEDLEAGLAGQDGERTMLGTSATQPHSRLCFRSVVPKSRRYSWSLSLVPRAWLLLRWNFWDAWRKRLIARARCSYWTK